MPEWDGESTPPEGTAERTEGSSGADGTAGSNPLPGSDPPSTSDGGPDRVEWLAAVALTVSPFLLFGLFVLLDSFIR